MNTLEENPREMRSAFVKYASLSQVNLTWQAVVNELHGVSPVQPQYEFPNLRGKLGTAGQPV